MEDYPTYIVESEHNDNGQSDQSGYVYILFRTDNPGVVKVGFTSVSAESRANNYTDGEWKVHKHFPMPVWLAKATERSSHKNLKNFWLNPKVTGGTASEIFTCSLETAEIAVQSAFTEELTKLLKTLRVPDPFVKFILNEHGIIESSDISTLVRQFQDEENKLLESVCEIENSLSEQIKNLQDKLEDSEQKLENMENVSRDSLEKIKKYFKNKESLIHEHFSQEKHQLQIQIIELKEKLEKSVNDLSVCKNKNNELITTNNELLSKKIEVSKITSSEQDNQLIELIKFSHKKIRYSQFELLQENFIKAVKLLEVYRYKK